MNRLASCILLLVFLSLGSGALEYAHNLQHAAEDAREDAKALATGHQPAEDHHHDESNCTMHAQLHMPLVVLGWMPVILSLGLLVELLTLRIKPLIPRAMPVRIDCRGPPFMG